jgi:hypothetical protein
LTTVADPVAAGEIVKRALGYPYPAPDRSFLFTARGLEELPAGPLELTGREPLLAYGANAAPEALARKLAALPDVELPVVRATLHDFDVVYSAHISPYGAVPATLSESRGTAAPVCVAYPTVEQRLLLAASEPNYRLSRLEGISCRLATGDLSFEEPIVSSSRLASLSRVDAFISRHGCLSLDGGEIALAAIEAEGRALPAMDEPEVLELARAALFPDLDLEEFILAQVTNGGLAPLPTFTTL